MTIQSETDQVLTPEQIVQPLDLSGIQQDGDAVDDDRHIQLARSGTQLDYMDNDHTPATPPLPPVSPRTPGRQRSPLYRMLNFSPRSPRFTFAASLASISPRRSGAPEKR
ncbi:unnamed protein product [Toxocara canis]|uniref:Catalase n=1 Tax=Toxocara canis TaxID=6265 RepID=A0A183U040_TOXCA|nr:unnamed protein product [Toxocara canis]